MATPTTALDLVLGLQNPNLFAKRIAKSISKGMEEGAKAAEKGMGNRLNELHIDAAKIGHNAEMEALKKRHKAYLKVQKTAHEALKNLKGKDNKDQRKALKEEIKARRIGMSKEIDMRSKAQAKLVSLYDEGMKQAAAGTSEKLVSGAEKFSSIVNGALSGNFDPSALTASLGKAFQEAAPQLVSKGTSMAAGGGVGAKIGPMLAKLGAAAGVIAGAAAGVAALIAVFAAAYSQTKTFNKAILEGSSALDLFAGTSQFLPGALQGIRDSAIGVTQEFRTSAQEVLALGSAMNQAGFTFREQKEIFGSNAKSMRLALVATQAFGVGSGEVAELMNTMTRDFAYGQQSIADGFLDIFGAAQMSGMGVKNFFTAVSEATSGMALYNFRLDDTLALLLGLEDVLGEDIGKEFFQELKQGYKDMGMQERTKTLMLTGSAGDKVLRNTAERLGEEFTEKFKEAFSKVTDQGAVKGAFEGAGIALGGGGGFDASALAGLSMVEVAKLQNAMNEAGGQMGEVALLIQNAARLQRGGVQGASNMEQAEALGTLDALSVLAMKMSGMEALSNKGVSDLRGADRMAFENITGISGDKFDQLADVFASVAANIGDDSLIAVVDALSKGEGLSDTALDPKKTNMEVMEAYAKAQLEETTSFTQVLQNGVVGILNKIYTLMDNSLLFGGGSEAPESDAQRKTRMGHDLKMAEQRLKIAQNTDKGDTGDAEQDVLASKARMRIEEMRAGAKQSGVPHWAVDAAVGRQLGVDAAGQQLSANVPEEKRAEILAEYAEKQIKGEEAAAKENEKGLGLLQRAIEDLPFSMVREAAFGELNALLDGDLNQEATRVEIVNAINAKGLGEDDKKKAMDALTRYQGADDAFIQTGAGGRSTVTRFNAGDSMVAFKQGGAFDRAGMLGGGGGGVVINNLTVHESGDPQRTLAMVRDGVNAALNRNQG
jgi:hypothetical protein